MPEARRGFQNRDRRDRRSASSLRTTPTRSTKLETALLEKRPADRACPNACLRFWIDALNFLKRVLDQSSMPEAQGQARTEFRLKKKSLLQSPPRSCRGWCQSPVGDRTAQRSPSTTR